MTEREPTVEEIREALRCAFVDDFSGTRAANQFWLKERAIVLARMALRTAEAEARAERAEGLIRQCVQGDYHRPVGKPYRDDGLPSKHDKCIHDAWMYEDCGSCIDLHFAALATPRPASPSPATVEALRNAENAVHYALRGRPQFDAARAMAIGAIRTLIAEAEGDT